MDARLLRRPSAAYYEGSVDNTMLSVRYKTTTT